VGIPLLDPPNTPEEQRQSITAWDVDTYLDQLTYLRGKRKGEPLAPGTIHGHWRVVKTLLRWCARHRIIKEELQLTKPEYAVPEIGYLTKAQQAELLQADLGYRDEAFIRLILDTGARLKAVLSVKWHNLEFDAERSRGICRVMDKGRKPRTCFVTSETWECLMSLKKHYEQEFYKRGINQDWPVFISYNGWFEDPPRQVGVRAIAHVFKRLSAELGFKVRPHKLRHTAGRNWALSGMPPQAIMKLLGHKSLRMVQRYTDLTGQDVEAAWMAAMG
jgi:integrase/recombinase XerD